jgi:hypothetical protein
MYIDESNIQFYPWNNEGLDIPDIAFRFSTEVDEVHEQLRQKAR